MANIENTTIDVRLERIFSDFLNHPEKKVLVLKGKWGVGKTFAWKTFVEQRQSNKEIKESAIAYVSLFGLKELNNLQQHIVQKAVPTNLKQLQKLSKVGIPLIQALKGLPIPYLKDAVEASDSLAALLVRKFLICFDDIERKADELPLAHILGLVSFLKEEKECRIVLIFNEDEIDNEEDKASLRKYREKVIDQEIAYIPAVKNNIRLIFQPAEFPNVQEMLGRLVINNIRIIKFVHWNVKHFHRYVDSLEHSIRDVFLENLTILTALYYQRDEDLQLSDLPDNYFTPMILKRKAGEQLSETELFLQRAEYRKQDFDAAIIDYLKNGDFDEIELKKIFVSLNRREKKKSTQQKLAALWRLFNGNFRASSAEVETAFKEFVEEQSGELIFAELNQIADLFTAIGRSEVSEKWRNDFIEAHIQDVTIEQAEFFKRQTSKPEIVEKLTEREKELQKGVSLKSTIYQLTEKRSWNPKDEAFLDSFTDVDYFKWFENEADEDLLTNLREFYRTFLTSPHNDYWKSISFKFKLALKKLCQRSALDKHRIETFFGKVGE